MKTKNLNNDWSGRKVKISDLIKEAHSNAKQKGFWDDEEQPFATKVMLIVTELSEAVEADRQCNIEGIREEIADTFIRLADLCGGYLQLTDIEKEIKRKMVINKGRPRLHGKNY